MFLRFCSYFVADELFSLMAIVSDFYSNIKDDILLYIQIYIDWILCMDSPVIYLTKDFVIDSSTLFYILL